MKIFFVRHSESEGNVNPKAYYDFLDCDIGITEEGKIQCEQAARDIMYHTAHGFMSQYSIFYSPFKRAKQTKDLIVKEIEALNGYRPYCYHDLEQPLLHERAFGSLREIIESRDFDKKKHYNFFFRPENGESLMDCYHRQATFFQYIHQNYPDIENLIIVSHGESIKCALMYLLNWTIEEFQSYKNPLNCEVLVVDDGKLITPMRIRDL